jgi:hypothetical protein
MSRPALPTRISPVLIGVLALSLLAGCGGGKLSLNPFKWFGPREKAVATVSIERPVDPRSLIAEIVALRLETVPTGVLVTATGRAAQQGAWQADLVAMPVTDGKLVLEFRAFEPRNTATGTPRSRDVTAGLHIRNGDLGGITSITVQGASNAKSARP